MFPWHAGNSFDYPPRPSGTQSGWKHGSGAASECSFFFANFAEISLRPLRSKALKALNRKARKGIGKDAKKTNCTTTENTLGQSCEATCRRVVSFDYFDAAGTMALGLGCLAMIWSLILS
jgi:hypothetical protein